LKSYEEKILQGWRYVRYLGWRHELLSNIKPHLKRRTPEAFMPLKGDKEAPVYPPINQQLSEGAGQELFRIIGTIGRS
jgi:hypothetical protein